MISEFKTKKGESSLPRVFSASLRGPAVPNGSASMENSMRTLYFSSYYDVLATKPSKKGKTSLPSSKRSP